MGSAGFCPASSRPLCRYLLEHQLDAKLSKIGGAVVNSVNRLQTASSRVPGTSRTSHPWSFPPGTVSQSTMEPQMDQSRWRDERSSPPAGLAYRELSRPMQLQTFVYTSPL